VYDFDKQAASDGDGSAFACSWPHILNHSGKERTMNSDRMAGAWHQLKGKVKSKWGRLTDDDLKQLEGHSEQLAGKLQERYGLAQDEAERVAKEFRSSNNWN
jgi:uncharacterized protein YjbJ (UPF0337 family)